MLNPDDDNAKFSYSWGLICSDDGRNIGKGIAILSQLLDNNSTHWRDCKYYISVGYLKKYEYSKALNAIDDLLMVEPNNMQALSLRKDIATQKMKGSFYYKA